MKVYKISYVAIGIFNLSCKDCRGCLQPRKFESWWSKWSKYLFVKFLIFQWDFSKCTQLLPCFLLLINLLAVVFKKNWC